MAKSPTPSDEISSIAGRIEAAKPRMLLASAQTYNDLLADAKKLAGFAMRADRTKGPNRPRKAPKHGG